ncbi:MAG: OsmC family protein [Bacteroidota bacterium]
MEINLRRIDDAFHMEATNEQGNKSYTDGSPAIGGGNKAMRPMEMVLTALASCSSVDIILILKKQRQQLDDLQIKITGDRLAEGDPKVFTNIHVHYDLYGTLKEKKVEQAIRLSVEKYCSVSKMIEKTAEITWSYKIH